VIHAFNNIRPLSAAEVQALWPLLVLRTAVLIVSGAQQAALDPDNDYVTEQSDGEWRMFSQATSLPMDVMTAVIKADPQIGKDIPDFLGLMKSVFDRLDAQPETVEITDPRTKQKVRVIVNKFVLQYIVGNNIGTTVTANFPALFYRASKGDFTNPAQVWLNISREEIGSAMSYMMDCASGQTAARREQIAREAKGTILEDVFNFPFPGICEEWKAPDLGDEFRSLLKSNVPTLFISGTLDARTPISNAEEYRKGFTNSTHMIIEGAVHSDPLFLSSPKIKDGMMEFLRGRPVTVTKISGAPMRFAPLASPSTQQ